MGTRVKEIILGDDCLNWDPVDETPREIYVMFWDVVKGDMGGAFEPPNGHIFNMIQNDITACLWESENLAYGWKASLLIQLEQHSIDLSDTVHANAHYFARTHDFSPPPEYQNFTNWYAHEFGNYGYDGFAVIFWLAKVLEIVEGFGWDYVTDLMLETFPVDAVDYVVKFCSHELQQNIKMRFTP